MTTINNYSVSLALDASSYIRNSSLSRKETQSLIREINSARSPADNYERSLNRLDAALKAGAIDQATYNRLLDSAKDKFNRTSKSAQSLTDQIKSQAIAFAAGYAGLQGFQRGMALVRDRMAEVDQVAKAARGINENTNALQRFQFALAEIGGIDGQTAITMLNKLNQRVGEASLGVGEAAKNFELLGVDIAAIENLRPVQQFEMVAAAIRKIENPTQQAALATKFFEESGTKLLPVLQASTAAYAESASQVDKLGLAVSDLEVANIEATNDAIGRLHASFKGLAGTVASMPSISDALGISSRVLSMIGALDKLGRAGSLDPTAFKGVLDQFGMTPMAEPKAPEAVKREQEAQAEFKKQIEDDAKVSEAITKGFADFGSSLVSSVEGAGKGLFGSVAGIATAVAQAVQASTIQLAETNKELVKSVADSPAISSLEAGSQEAYQFLTQSNREAMDEQRRLEAEKKARDEKAEQQRQRQLQWLERLNNTLEMNGFGRIR